MIHSNLFLNCSPCEGENLNPLNVKNSQLASKIYNLLALTVGLLTCQVIKKKKKKKQIIFFIGGQKNRGWTKPKEVMESDRIKL